MRRFQFTLKGLLLFVMIAAVLMSALKVVFREEQYAARVSRCTSNMKMIGMALLLYHDSYGCFPPAHVTDKDGRPMHSWRVLLLPYLGERALYAQYDFREPWDSVNNRRLAKHVPHEFRCPMDPSKDPTTTSYLAVVGPQAAWPGSRSTNFKDFVDGSSYTIMLVERTDSGIRWTEPRDISLDEAAAGVNTKSGKGIRSPHPSPGATVGLADCSAERLSPDIPPELLKGLLTIDGGEDVREFYAD